MGRIGRRADNRSRNHPIPHYWMTWEVDCVRNLHLPDRWSADVGGGAADAAVAAVVAVALAVVAVAVVAGVVVGATVDVVVAGVVAVAVAVAASDSKR